MRVEFERRVLRLFDEMLEQPPPTRARWLETATGGDRALIRAIEAMAAADAASGLLPTQPPDPRPPLEDAPPPARIGKYRIAGELGRGGMGVVYLAERDDGLFDHKAAIKLIRRTSFSEAALAQFAIERRILARLRHPHIAQMLDGGVTEDGASYIVMERIHGTPITDFAAARDLPLAARLDLFGEVLDAAEHAHRNLIVHADIKPSNVVVEEGFGVKLLDFGIARLLDDAERQRHGAYTPGFASPARIAGMAPAIADDVFAAGVLLRDLIEGVAGTDADLAAIAAFAAADDPARRYGTIGAFAADIARWRAHLPVTARPPARKRRLVLFWRRHRLAVLLGTIGSAVLLATLIATTALWLRAERARADAETRFDETRAMANYMLSDVDPQLARLPGTLPLRRRLVSRSRAYLQRLEAEPRASAALDLDIAAGYLRLAQVYGFDVSGGIGDFAAARDSLRHARALLAAVPADDARDPRMLRLRAQAHLTEGSEVFVAPQDATLDQALADLFAAQALFARYLKMVPGDVDAQLALWRAQVMTGRAYLYRGQNGPSQRIVERHLGSRAMAVRTAEQRAQRDFILNGSYLMLAESYEESDPRRSFQYYDQLVRHVTRMRQEGRSDMNNDFIQATALAGKGGISRTLHDLPAAIASYEESLAAMQRLLDFGPNHEVAAYRAYVRLQLAEAYARAGRRDLARAESDRAIAWFRVDLGGPLDRGARERMLALALQGRSQIEQRVGDRATACRVDSAAVAQWALVRRVKAVMPIDTARDGPIERVQTARIRDCATS